MAANRTFQFMGIGYGNASITASIQGTEIFSGPVTSIDEVFAPWPSPPADQDTHVVLFTLDNSELLNTDFSGTVSMTSVVTGGDGVSFGKVNSNWYLGRTDGATATNFQQCNQPMFGITADTITDSRSNVLLDGSSFTPARPPNGCFTWPIPNGVTFTCDLSIAKGWAGEALSLPDPSAP